MSSRDCRRCLTRRDGLDELAPRASAELARRGHFEEDDEWRISTYTKKRIERIEGGYLVRCETDGVFEAFLKTEEDALAACALFSDLQASLFYAIAWPSRAAQPRRDTDDRDMPWPLSLLLRDPCKDYLSGLSANGRGRASAIANEALVLLERGETWERGNASLRRTPAPHAGGNERETNRWIEGRVERDGLKFVSASPTVERAAEFLVVYEGIARDIQRERGW